VANSRWTAVFTLGLVLGFLVVAVLVLLVFVGAELVV
jgi:hypothetical protein